MKTGKGFFEWTPEKIQSTLDAAALCKGCTRISFAATAGIVYVTHGLAGVSLVGLVIAHIYFALRPEKLWITKAMVFGYITQGAEQQ